MLPKRDDGDYVGLGGSAGSGIRYLAYSASAVDSQRSEWIIVPTPMQMERLLTSNGEMTAKQITTRFLMKCRAPGSPNSRCPRETSGNAGLARIRPMNHQPGRSTR